MEKRNVSLLEAAMQGSVQSLCTLLSQDPMILDRCIVDSFSETPLHAAALLGHADFISEILSARPHLLREVNAMHSTTPLHMASAKGHVSVVRLLLEADPQASSIRDKNHLLPMHLAAMNGNLRVLEVFLGNGVPDMTVSGQETILHLSVERGQLGALKIFLEKTGTVDAEMLNAKDDNGNTVLHLAVAYRQIKIIKFLVGLPGIEINSMNVNGCTPLDMFMPSAREVGDADIERSLSEAGGVRLMRKRLISTATKEEKSKTDAQGWIENKRRALEVVAVLLATVSVQMVLNPPGGVWQDDGTHTIDASGIHVKHTAGQSIAADKYFGIYGAYTTLCTLSFISSVGIILLPVSGIPIKHKFFVGILMTITVFSVIFLGFACALGIYMLSPSILAIVVSGLIALQLFLVILYHAIRLMIKLYNKLKTVFTGTTSVRQILAYRMWGRDTVDPQD